MTVFEEPACRLRIYIGEADRFDGETLYRVLVKRLRAAGVWGATATRGLYGYGKRSHIHAASPLRLSADLPVIVEAVDSEEKIRRILPEISALVPDGLVTLEPVTVVTRSEQDGGRPDNVP